MFELTRAAFSPEGLEGRARQGGRWEAAAHGAEELFRVVEIACVEQVLAAPDPPQCGVSGDAIIDR
ncbi:hypothetical protein [Archangium sp.]|uniref:hypothetical protein n=1 Tax=Archangium sp. TaxID=1872627 RepID=UPI002D39AD32|nr:hypothetical protein [Archangium sp.]HYO52210.1 hypothetical protein [Archangium sp.]